MIKERPVMDKRTKKLPKRRKPLSAVRPRQEQSRDGSGKFVNLMDLVRGAARRSKE